ncbi:MAG: OmpA family protein [Mariprofundaceae bacterium]|nr:OmpA family protein [Mariprofundaceae bacterium]
MKRIFLLAACASITACAGHIASPQISELDEVRAMIQKAKDAGAERCAPALQAKAVAGLYHAAHEIVDEVNANPIDENNDLISTALSNAKKAYTKAVKGCGKPAPEVITLEGVFFETNKADLTASSTATLERAVKTLQKRSKINVEVAAHTDSRGKASYNLDLSNRRAASVMDYLVTHGVNASRLSAKGYGEIQPRADNSSVQGRAKNRRVELRIK